MTPLEQLQYNNDIHVECVPQSHAFLVQQHRKLMKLVRHGSRRVKVEIKRYGKVMDSATALDRVKQQMHRRTRW